jgi:beta-galactosidase/beta-glucuronidase
MYPDDPPKVPHDVDPTGAYVTSIDLPRSREKRRTLLRFEGVTSGYPVWVNGDYAGYDQAATPRAEFDISERLHHTPTGERPRCTAKRNDTGGEWRGPPVTRPGSPRHPPLGAALRAGRGRSAALR